MTLPPHHQPQPKQPRPEAGLAATLHILLVEDNEDDVFLMKRALGKTKLPISLTVVSDGAQAMDYLSDIGKAGCLLTHPFPDIAFLDLKLPFLDGFEVLAHIRTRRTLDALRIVILSSSLEDSDSENARRLGVPSSMKPPTTEMLLGVLGRVEKSV